MGLLVLPMYGLYNHCETENIEHINWRYSEYDTQR